MAIYSIARNGTATTSGNAHFDVACSTGVRPRIMEWGIFLAAATASTFGLNRPSTLGTRTSPLALMPEEASDPALTGITLVDSAVAWSAEPTEATTDLRTIALPATIGTGVIWTFPRGLSIAISLPIIVLNRATNAASTWCHVAADI